MSKKASTKKNSNSHKQFDGKTGSVVPQTYKTKYRATSGEHRCGDKLSDLLKAATLNDEGKSDLKKIRAVAKENGLSVDKWLHLNPGMIRMNMGNVLRGMIRSEGSVKVGGKAVKTA